MLDTKPGSSIPVGTCFFLQIEDRLSSVCSFCRLNSRRKVIFELLAF